MRNNFTFGKYKGKAVTDILLHYPDYFGWCIRNVKFFRFSIRDYEIYLSYLYTCNNHMSFTGYPDKDKIISFIRNKRLTRGDWNEFSDTEYLTPPEIHEYLETRHNKIK